MTTGGNLAWIDLETTGLDPTKDAILEIALVCTNPDLQILCEESFVIDWQGAEEEIIGLCGPKVLAVHEANGLFGEMLTPPIRPFAKVAIDSVERMMVDRMRAAQCTGLAIGNDPYRSPMCGSTISFDRGFLKAQMPTLEAAFSYRNVDVSSLKEICQRWYPAPAAAPGLSVHRALPDIHHSISWLRSCRAEHFQPSPARAAGPGLRVLSRADFEAAAGVGGAP